MKKLLCGLALVFTSSTFAVSNLTCNVLMLGKALQSSKKTVSPILTGQGLNSVLRAKDHQYFLSLYFNSKTLSESKAHVILDGRYRHVPMNIHMSVEEKNNILTIMVRDTVSSASEIKDFDIDSAISLQLKNTNGVFEVECEAQP